MDSALVTQLGGRPGPTDATSLRQTLAADDVEGETGGDWGQGHGPHTVCYVSDGRGGYYYAILAGFHGWV